MAEVLRKEVSKDSLAHYVIAESVRRHKVANNIGKTAVRHCPLTMRLAILVRSKMGFSGRLYDLLATVMGLPTDRTLQQYTIPTTNQPDGMLINNIF